MDSFALLSPSDRTDALQEAANRRGTTLGVIEKDFWVCWTLGHLFALPSLGPALIFKGGTSLSKVFGLLKRFSEDIDLSIRRDYLGLEGEQGVEADGISNSERRRRIQMLRERCRKCVHGELLPALTASFDSVLGPGTLRGWSLLPDSDEPGTLLFSYPRTAGAASASRYLRPVVKLEMGAGSDPYPLGIHIVRPYVAEEFSHLFTAPTTNVIAMEAERTFWEKATLLHAEYHRPVDQQPPVRLTRHYYDIARLMASPIGPKALADWQLLERVVQHKSTYFSSGWANYGTARPGTFRLVPNAARVAALRRDYEEMHDMFMETPPPFEELIQSARDLERAINSDNVDTTERLQIEDGH